MRTKESAQNFFDSMRASLDKAKAYFNPKNHPTSTDSNLDNGEGLSIGDSGSDPARARQRGK